MFGRSCLLTAVPFFVLQFSGVVAADSQPPPPRQTCRQTGRRESDPRQSGRADRLIRVVRDAHDRPLALETGIGHYVSPSAANPFTVDLIGCIHVADKKYYETLNERFKHYDAVLFELVMPEGGSLENLGKRESNHPISRVQQSLPKILDLNYQLKDIDYTAKNFVHADLSPDEMAKAIKARGDSGGSVFIKVLFDILRESNRQTQSQQKHGGEFAEFELLAALFDSNRPRALKRLMADQMEIDGIGNGSWANPRYDPRQGPQRGGHESARSGKSNAGRGRSPSFTAPPTCPTSTAA